MTDPVRRVDLGRRLPGTGAALVATRPALPGERGTHIAAVSEWLAGLEEPAAGPDARSGAPPASQARSGVRPPALLRGAPLASAAYADLGAALAAAAGRGSGEGITYVLPGGRAEHQPYERLLEEARAALGGLRALGLRPGDPVLFQFAGNRGFTTAFWACVLGGFLPTPVSLAPTYREWNAVTRKLRSAWDLLERPIILSDRAALPGVAQLSALWDDASVRVAALEEVAGAAAPDDGRRPDPTDPAVLLLTSGSTGVPKCVRHTHATLLARVAATAEHCGFTSDDVSLNWMPLDHVGGIVMYVLRDVVLGCPHVSAPIDLFLSDPLSWLDWMDRFRVTNTWAPNFAFALVNERHEAIASGRWDLSSVRHVGNGGEAVVARTASRFLELLRPHGLPADAMRPLWGMSETGSAVTFGMLDLVSPERCVVVVDKASLGGDLRTVEPGDPGATTFVPVGGPIPGVELRIADERGGVQPEGRIGRLQVRGATLMTGYLRNDAANARSFTADGWFDTGDLAFVHDAQLVIAGRDSDRIVVSGVNYLSYDIESIVEQVDGVAATWSAAAATPDDRLIVFFVPERDEPEAICATARAIPAALGRQLGISPHRVVPVARERFPKTASGKIQRSALVSAFVEGAFADALRRLDVDCETESAVPAWFFRTAWMPEATAVPAVRPAGPTLLLGTDGPLTALLARRLGAPVVRARPASEFAGDADTGLSMDPSNPLHHLRLIDELRRAGMTPARVVSVLERPQAWEAEPLGPALSLLWLAQALARRVTTTAEVLVVTEGAHAVAAGERTCPPAAALGALLRTAAAEGLRPAMRQVDLGADERAEDRADAVLAELGQRDGPAVVAYRGGRRHLRRLRPCRPPPAGGAALPRGGAYVVTGGLGGIGLELSRFLLAAYDARILVIGRPGGSASDRLRRLGETDAVRYAGLDVADAAAVAGAVGAAEAAWDRPVDGLFHLAAEDVSGFWGGLEAHQLVAESADTIRRVCAVKVEGARSLAALLADRPRAHLTLFSSVNGFFGGSSFGAYALASALLDACAERWWAEHPGRVRSLAWSAWEGIGMSARTAASAAMRGRGFLAMSSRRALASLAMTLSLPHPCVLIGVDRGSRSVVREVAPDDLTATEATVVYEGASDVSAERLRAALADELGPADRVVARRVVTLTPELVGRPEDLWRAALAPADDGEAGREGPRSETERLVAGLWIDLLGGDSAATANFFEHGGTSLAAAQLVARINAATGAGLVVRDLYEHPTIRGLAGVIGSSGSDAP